MPSPSFYSRLGRLSAVVLVLPSAMAGGWVFGRYVFDRHLGTNPWGAIIFTLIGAVAGFYEIIKILMMDQRSRND